MDSSCLYCHTNREVQAEQAASRQIPVRWYEAYWVIFAVFIPLSSILLLLTLPKFMFSPPLWLSVVAMMIHASGWWLDTMTTHQSMALRPEFDRRKLYYPSYETNPLTRETPHLVLQLLSPSTVLALIAAAAALFVPAMVIGYGVIHAMAAYANHRHTRRMRLQLKIYDGLAGGDGLEAGKENGRETHSGMMLAGPFQLVIPN